MKKLLIVDDHPFIREGLKKVVSTINDLEIVGECSRGSELISIIKQTHPDGIILDIGLPDKDGLDVLKDVKILYPELPVLILSMYPTEQFALRAFRNGASGYISKTAPPEEFIKALRKIVNNKKYVTEEVANIFADGIDFSKKNSLDQILSDREFQVFLMLATGKKALEIAEKLKINEQTVYSYRHRIFQKLHLKSIPELVMLASKHHLI